MSDNSEIAKSFLSHNSRDKPAVEVIQGLLERGDLQRGERPIPCWFDKDDLRSTGTWMSQLEDAVATCGSAVVFYGPDGRGPVHKYEVELLLKRAMYEQGREAIRLVLVLLPGAQESAIQGFISLHMWADFRKGLDDAAALQRLRAFILGKAPKSGPGNDPKVPKPEIEPYRGLEPFEGKHAIYFFGRDNEIKELCGRLQEWPFTAVIGGSGSGKSSIVRAGLQTDLATQERPALAHTTTITVRPGSSPIRVLADQVVASLSDQSGTIAERLKLVEDFDQQFRTGSDKLLNVLRSLYPRDDQHILLVIDQFEELFTHSSDNRTAEPSPSGSPTSDSPQTQFVELLAAVAKSQLDRLRIVITLRADFFDRCLSVPTLKSLIENRTLLLGKLADDALRTVIEAPALKVGAYFEKGLLAHILKDVENQNGSLPLLQHALKELWEQRRFGFLTDDAYDETGGVEGALKKRADATLQNLSEDQREIAKNVFLRLTTLGEGVSDTRRRVRKNELYPEKTDPRVIDAVLKDLSSQANRLIVTNDDGTVEVTHEALIQRWDTLKGWLAENRDDKRLHDRLRDAANEWADPQHGRDSSYLWEGGRIDLADKFDQTHPNMLTALEREFLTACRQERDAENRRIRRNSRIAVVVAIFTLAVSLVALYEWSAAETERGKAEAQLLDARHNLGLALLERASKFRAEGKNAHAFLTAGRAIGFHGCGGPLVGYPELLRTDTEDFLRAASIARHCAPHSVWPERALQTENDFILGLAINPSGDMLAAEGAVREIHVWRLATRKVEMRFKGLSTQVLDIQFSPDGKRLASSHRDGTVQLWSLSSEKPKTLIGHVGEVYRISFSPNGKLLASAGSDRTARIWDVESGNCLHHMTDYQDQVQGIAFSPDSELMVTGSSGGMIHIHRTDSGNLENVFRAHLTHVWSIAFHPNGGRFVSGGGDHLVKSWDLSEAIAKKSPAPRETLDAHKDHVWRVTFSTDGRRLATASWDGTVRLWDAATMQSAATLDVFNGRVDGLMFVPGDSSRVVTVAKGDQICLWHIPAEKNSPTQFLGHTAPVGALCYHPGGKLLASGSWDKTIRLWDVRTGGSTLLYTHSDFVNALAFSQSGERLFAGGSDGRLFSITVPKGDVAMSANDKVGGWINNLVLSPDGLLVVSAGGDGKIRVSDAETGLRITEPFQAHSGYVTNVCFNSDGSSLVSSGGDGRICIWDRKSWTLVQMVPVHETHKTEQDVGCIVAPDGLQIISAGWDGKICLTEIRSGVTVTTLKGRGESYFKPLAVTRDMKRLAVTSFDRTVRVWDLQSKRQVEIMPENTPYLYALALSPDDRRLAYSGENGTIRFMDMQPPEVPPLAPSRFHFDGLDVVFGQMKPSGTKTP